jgi:hypothetical protein
MATADDLDRHIQETADMARAAMAGMLGSIALAARQTPPAAALAAASSLAVTADRLGQAITATSNCLADGDEDSASLDAARVMTLSDYALRLARLRSIAAQMSAYDEAQSGSAS